jgi:hypothetical protein
VDAKYRDVASQISRLAASVEPEDDPLPSHAGNGAKANGAPAAAATVAPTPMPAAGASKARKVGYL